MIADDAVRSPDPCDRARSGKTASRLVDLLMRDAEKTGQLGVF
jgi:hypothetical protein